MSGADTLRGGRCQCYGLALHMAVKGCRRPSLTHASGTHPPQLWRPSDRGESQTRTFCGIASNKAKPKILPLQFEVYIIVFLVPLRSIIFIGIMFGGLHLYIDSHLTAEGLVRYQSGLCSIYDGRRTGTDWSSFAV